MPAKRPSTHHLYDNQRFRVKTGCGRSTSTSMER